MGRIFISYRREDSPADSGRIYDRLWSKYGRENVFKDVDNIPLGADFRRILSDEVARCEVMLVVIGRQWVGITDEAGERRLDSTSDFVRIEVEAALERGIPVVPLLVQNTVMPRERDLPPSLAPLVYRNGMSVRSNDPFFHGEMDLLVRRLDMLFATAQTDQIIPVSKPGQPATPNQATVSPSQPSDMPAMRVAQGHLRVPWLGERLKHKIAGENGALSGQRLGDYLLLDLLNVGGMAEVYRGRDLTNNHDVAVKVLPPALAADPQYVTRFKYEAALVGKLAHPNIVPIERYGEQGPYLYLVMPLLDGSLRDILNQGQRIHPADAVIVGTQIASALAAVHALGLIHRDVKPDNILFSRDRALLTDFGITRRIEVKRPGQIPTLVGTGLPVGTPQYMAPEQLDGQHVDHRADLYALGAVLYELLTGRPPHVADGPYAVAARVLQDPIVPPSQLNPAVWPELDAVVMRALARDPADRYANAASMRDALQRIETQLR
jgi:protein kinase-like protein/TIR domain-containing protein